MKFFKLTKVLPICAAMACTFISYNVFASPKKVAYIMIPGKNIFCKVENPKQLSMDDNSLIISVTCSKNARLPETIPCADFKNPIKYILSYLDENLNLDNSSDYLIAKGTMSRAASDSALIRHIYPEFMNNISILHKDYSDDTLQ